MVLCKRQLGEMRVQRTYRQRKHHLQVMIHHRIPPDEQFESTGVRAGSADIRKSYSNEARPIERQQVAAGGKCICREFISQDRYRYNRYFALFRYKRYTRQNSSRPQTRQALANRQSLPEDRFDSAERPIFAVCANGQPAVPASLAATV
jgi:hypothetical protein